MCKFDEFLESVRERARWKMDCDIRRSETSAALGNFTFQAKPTFSESEKQSLRQIAEEDAVNRVLAALYKFAFPDE